MSILDTLNDRKSAIAKAAAAAIVEAKSAGVSVYYDDPSIGEGIVEERPDGTKKLITNRSERAA
ncbi:MULTISPECIES: hypothetical protein [Pseudorhizobium]|jgi:hypothetical protein|uniref:hypothetical protein n=1 Tax=Pseudorhizobium TaxID=1903858 RepID=UPI00049836A3|nr:hypothetical protein [Pseudorhizobium marinum]MBU1315663.1 hypothetical protein [Alphaproteobacteria bacterium]MBU1550994.1 hypothetical protein [Alphaproteobacteria bacterium]MBU2339130.1 hypothetical protein [Alphaproteobacteria bacterium]MBU2387221.1 hypothetical protein [Alphaproteobacteria bacterium]